MTGWWFGTMEFYDFPYVGNDIMTSLHHFSEGWLNHQPDDTGRIQTLMWAFGIFMPLHGPPPWKSTDDDNTHDDVAVTLGLAPDTCLYNLRGWCIAVFAVTLNEARGLGQFHVFKFIGLTVTMSQEIALFWCVGQVLIWPEKVYRNHLNGVFSFSEPYWIAFCWSCHCVIFAKTD